MRPGYRSAWLAPTGPVAPRNPARDRDQETIWCTEFNQLQALVMRDGGEVVIERALEAGAQSLKTVALEAIGQTTATNVGAEHRLHHR